MSDTETVVPAVTPAPVPVTISRPSVAWYLTAFLVLVVVGQGLHMYWSHTSPSPAPLTVHAVISDEKGGEPVHAVPSNQMLILSSRKSMASSTRWAIEPASTNSYQIGENFIVNPGLTPFTVRLLVVKGEVIDEATAQFTVVGGNSPQPLPGPAPGPAPPPAPKPLPANVPQAVVDTARAYFQAQSAALRNAQQQVLAGSVSLNGSPDASGKPTKTTLLEAISAGRRPASQAMAEALQSAPDLAAALGAAADVMEVK